MRGQKFFASFVVVVMLIGFTGVVAYGQTDPATTDPAAATDPGVVEEPKMDPVIAARQASAAAVKQAEELTGEPMSEIVYDLGEDDSDVGGIVGKVILILALVFLLILSVLALAKIGALKKLLVKAGVIEEEKKEEEKKEEGAGEGEGDPEVDDLDDIFGPEEQPEGAREGGFSLISLLFGLVAVGMIIAMLAPVAFAAKDKVARQIGVANLQSVKAHTASIGAMKVKVDGAVQTATDAKTAAEAAKGAVDTAIADAQAKIDQMVKDAEAKIAEMVANAGTGNDAAIKKNADAITAIKRDYVKQGGPEERALLGYIVVSAGVNLDDEPELKELVGEYKGTRAQRAKFAELLAAAMPSTVTQAQLEATNTALTSVVEGIAAMAEIQKGLASKDYVIGAIADSRKVLMDKMAANLAAMKALVDGVDASKVEALDRKIDAVAEASILGAVEATEESLEKFAEIYGKDWVREQIKLITED